MSFPPTYMRHVYSGFEPAQAFDVVYGGAFEHRLLSSKLATMAHQRLILGDLRVETGSYDFPVVAQGCMPKDALCIGFMAAGGQVTRYNTALIDEDEIQIYPSGVDLLYHASGSSHWVNFTVSEERLQQAALARSGHMLTIEKHSAYSVRLRPGGRAALAVLVHDAMAIAQHFAAKEGLASALAAAIGDSLLACYVDALLNAIPTGKSEQSSAAQRHHHLITACERLALSGASSDITLIEIARRSGYTLRSLEMIFRRGVGMTPGRWFMNARLNGALRDLIACDADDRVVDIASKWGFRHPPRFAQYYRHAFGESPSDTMRRGRTGSPNR